MDIIKNYFSTENKYITIQITPSKSKVAIAPTRDCEKLVANCCGSWFRIF